MIGAIENAIIARIASANRLGLLGYKLKTVDSYDGVLDDPDSAKRAIAAMPAAYVSLIEEKPVRATGNGKWQVVAEFFVAVCATSKRNEADRRHGAAGAVGVYQMAHDVRTLLTDQGLGLDVSRVEYVRTRPVRLAWLNDLGISALAVDLRVPYELLAAPDIGTAANDPAGTIPASAAAGGAGNSNNGGTTLLGALNTAAGITDFNLVHADWQAPLAKTDTINLEEPA